MRNKGVFPNLTRVGMMPFIFIIILGVLGLIYMNMNNSFLTSPAGVLELRLTDAPTDGIESLIVTISGTRVHGPEGWVSVKEDAAAFDLLSLRSSDASALLGEAPLAPGHYTQIRMEVTNAIVITSVGANYQVTIPSGELKMVKGFDILPNKKLTLTLDFDADTSLHTTGNGKYILRPTVTVLAENVDCIQDADCPGYVADATCGDLVSCVEYTCTTNTVACPTTTIPPTV